MVEKLGVSYIDDLDGGIADETVQFNLDGRDYEIDLSLLNAASMRQIFSVYLVVARRKLPGPSPRSPQQKRLEHNRTVRAWAARQGIRLRPRGRIPADVVSAYHRAA